MTENLLKPGERLDDLQRNGLHIIQHPRAFRFGMDAVLLADFTRLRPRERVADMGTGTGILPLLLSQKQPDARFEAFEIQPEMADMARRSVALNGLEERIRVHAADMRAAYELIGRESMHAVVCNPPYGKQEGRLPMRRPLCCLPGMKRTVPSRTLRRPVPPCFAPTGG